MKRVWKIAGMLILGLAFATPTLAGSYAGKKVLFVDSYHQGYASADGIREGINTAFAGKGIDLKIVYMDTKRNPDEAFARKAALQAREEIGAFNPDLVIAGDDAAAKYLIAPYYRDAKLPFVFCGVNWDASGYGLPCSNVTGMLEVAPVRELIQQLKGFAKGNRVGYVAADNLTIRKDVEMYKKKLGLDLKIQLAKTMDEWQKAVAGMQGQVDMLIIGNAGGIEKWNSQEAMKFLLANVKTPTGAIDDHMAPFGMLGFTKVPQEQGFFAANAALKILDGTTPTAIPVVANKEGRLTVNLKIAKTLGITLPYSLVGTAKEVFQ